MNAAQTILKSSAEKELGFYTPLEEALEELYHRRKLSTLQDKICDDLQLTPELSELCKKPHLVFFRQLATPMYETLRFLELAKKIGLDPFILEYHEDKFVSKGNNYKRGLGKMRIFQFTSPSGVDVYENKTVVDFNANIGESLNAVRTTRGESLLGLHHELFNELTHLQVTDVAHDGSSWFNKFGGAREYYDVFLRLFIRDAILAEIFLPTGEEGLLTNTVVHPAFQRITNQFGLKPLIWSYLPNGEETREFWGCYPKETKDFLVKKGYI